MINFQIYIFCLKLLNSINNNIYKLHTNERFNMQHKINESLNNNHNGMKLKLQICWNLPQNSNKNK